MSDHIALAVQALEGAADLLDQESAARLMGVLARRLLPPGDDSQATISRGQASALDDCAEIYVPIPQWTTADLSVRGVWLRAPTFRDCMLAERAATIRDPKTGEERIDEWRQIAEEVAACITRPNRITVDVLLDWNVEVVYGLHRRLRGLAALPGAVVAAELARLAGGPPPPPPSAPEPAYRPPPRAPREAPGRPAANVPAADAEPEPAPDNLGGNDRSPAEPATPAG